MPKSRTRKRREEKKANNTIWIAGAVVGAVVLVLALVLINLNTGSRTPTPVSSVSAGRTLGKDTAPVTIELYSDFQ